MGARQKEWARQARVRLKAELGDRCADCTRMEPEVILVFDCIKACGDAHHRMEMSQRMSFYHAQHKAKNIQLLCEGCNTKKSAAELPPREPETTNPF